MGISALQPLPLNNRNNIIPNMPPPPLPSVSIFLPVFFNPRLKVGVHCLRLESMITVFDFPFV